MRNLASVPPGSPEPLRHHNTASTSEPEMLRGNASGISSYTSKVELLGSSASILWSGGCFSCITPLNGRPVFLQKLYGFRTPPSYLTVNRLTTCMMQPYRRVRLKYHDKRSSHASGETCGWFPALTPPLAVTVSTTSAV